MDEGGFKVLSDEIEISGVKIQTGLIVYRYKNKNYVYQTAGIFGTNGVFPMLGKSETTGYMYDARGNKITGDDLIRDLAGTSVVLSGGIDGLGVDVSFGRWNRLVISGGLSTNPGLSAGISISERVNM